jgi:hypothetical protein
MTPRLGFLDAEIAGFADLAPERRDAARILAREVVRGGELP